MMGVSFSSTRSSRRKLQNQPNLTAQDDHNFSVAAGWDEDGPGGCEEACKPQRSLADELLDAEREAPSEEPKKGCYEEGLDTWKLRHDILAETSTSSAAPNHLAAKGKKTDPAPTVPRPASGKAIRPEPPMIIPTMTDTFDWAHRAPQNLHHTPETTVSRRYQRVRTRTAERKASSKQIPSLPATDDDKTDYPAKFLSHRDSLETLSRGAGKGKKVKLDTQPPTAANTYPSNPTRRGGLTGKAVHFAEHLENVFNFQKFAQGPPAPSNVEEELAAKPSIIPKTPMSILKKLSNVPLLTKKPSSPNLENYPEYMSRFKSSEISIATPTRQVRPKIIITPPSPTTDSSLFGSRGQIRSLVSKTHLEVPQWNLSDKLKRRKRRIKERQLLATKWRTRRQNVLMAEMGPGNSRRAFKQACSEAWWWVHDVRDVE